MANTKRLALPKETWIGLVSSLVEAYNMALYSFTAPILAKWIFHQKSASSALFFSYSLLLVGSCLLYPAGALYYGRLGDKKGRQKICTYSTLGLAIATGLMGIIPFDWIYFFLLLCAQHFFSGGEYQGSIVFSIEHAEKKNNGILSALSCLFAVLGLCFANGFATLAQLTENAAWVRGAFLLGAVGGILSYLLKNHCRETPAFVAILPQHLQTSFTRSFLKEHWRTVLSATIVFAFFIVSYSFLFLFLPLVCATHIEIESFNTLHSLILYGLFLIFAGGLADKLGMQRIMSTGLSLFSIALIPLCYFCTSMRILQGTLTLFACLVIGPIHGWMSEQFKPEQRCRGVFTSSAIATSLFGASTVPICLILFEKSHSLIVCALYPLLIALGAFCILQKKEAS